MASPVTLYQQEMHTNLGFFPTWLPGDPMEVGAVGVLAGGCFRRATSLQELGVPCEVSAAATTQDVQYTSSQGTKIAFAAGAALPGAGQAEITIDFSRQAAFVFHVTGLRQHRLDNRAAVAERIMKAYKKDKWKKEWLLVDAVHSADRTTIIVAEDASAGLVLAAKSDGPIASVSLADPKVNLAVTSARGKLVHIIAGKGLRPLYACLRLYEPWFGRPKLGPVRGPATAADENRVIRPGIEELLES